MNVFASIGICLVPLLLFCIVFLLSIKKLSPLHLLFALLKQEEGLIGGLVKRLVPVEKTNKPAMRRSTPGINPRNLFLSESFIKITIPATKAAIATTPTIMSAGEIGSSKVAFALSARTTY